MKQLRLSLVLLVAALCLVPGSRLLAAAAPPIACPPLGPVVSVEFGQWGGPGTGLKQELFALVGSKGANRPGGYMIFGAATPTRAEADQGCRRTPVRAKPSRRALSKRYSYRRSPEGYVFFKNPQGNTVPGELLHPRSTNVVAARQSYGVRFRCFVQRAVTVLITDSRDRRGRVVGTYFSARLGRQLIATAVLRRGSGSFFRISKQCEWH